ncbi:MAG: hypothetical protein Q4A36_01930 [Candidatus Saccharibacteria bacterium]|nr:hypothetical protein [Candidatus Saccharibacteria bacterium]
MAKSKELMAKNKRLSKEIESLKAADAAAAKKVAATEDYYKKQLRQQKQQDQQAEDDEQQQKTDQQQKEAPPQRQQKKANPPQDVAPATLDYTYHKDGVGKAYKYWDAETRTWGITSDYWAARQIGGDIWSVIWVWYSDGQIDHLLSVEEMKRYLP